MVACVHVCMSLKVLLLYAAVSFMGVCDERGGSMNDSRICACFYVA